MNSVTNSSKITSAKNTRQLLREIKENDQDFEWYPTTQKMIDTVKRDIKSELYDKSPTILDCGAGDGRVLKALTKSDKYAIEKSRPLLDALDSNIYIVGTEFNEQTLIDKKVDIIFSNPPYSEYEYWSSKIITEGNAGLIYLIIPERWCKNKEIKKALEAREAKTKVIAEFDFLTADRKARSKINIVKVILRYKREHFLKYTSLKTNPFDIWFDEHFKIEIQNESRSKYRIFDENRKNIKKTSEKALCEGGDLATVLVQLYKRDLDELLTHYKNVESLDPILLNELDVNLSSVKAGLKMKIEGLKDLYWEELFNHFKKITDKLTSSTRKEMLDKLTMYTHVDFTLSNIHAIAIWVMKNANQYYDNQLIKIVESMTEYANIHNYVSNQRTFDKDGWRYNKTPDDLTHYKLDYRIVLERAGGLRSSTQLSEEATKFINDLCIIANNIGFDTRNFKKSNSYNWESKRKNTFLFENKDLGLPDILFDVAAFINSNLHFSFNQNFIMHLNVEFGRLKGWLKSPKEAAEELNIPLEEAAKAFQSNLAIQKSEFSLIGMDIPQ